MLRRSPWDMVGDALKALHSGDTMSVREFTESIGWQYAPRRARDLRNWLIANGFAVEVPYTSSHKLPGPKPKLMRLSDSWRGGAEQVR